MLLKHVTCNRARHTAPHCNATGLHLEHFTVCRFQNLTMLLLGFNLLLLKGQRGGDLSLAHLPIFQERLLAGCDTARCEVEQVRLQCSAAQHTCRSVLKDCALGSCMPQMEFPG